MTQTITQSFIDYTCARLDQLEGQAAAIRLSTLKMVVYLTAGHNESLRTKCLDACLGAGLATTSCIETLNEDVAKILKEVSDGRR